MIHEWEWIHNEQVLILVLLAFACHGHLTGKLPANVVPAPTEWDPSGLFSLPGLHPGQGEVPKDIYNHGRQPREPTLPVDQGSGHESNWKGEAKVAINGSMA